MMRLLVLAALAIVGCKLVLGKWPWELFGLVSNRGEAVQRARVLLGVRPDATREEIVDAHRRLIAMVHPDRGGTNEQVHEANAARDLLLGNLPKPY